MSISCVSASAPHEELRPLLDSKDSPVPDLFHLFSKMTARKALDSAEYLSLKKLGTIEKSLFERVTDFFVFPQHIIYAELIDDFATRILSGSLSEKEVLAGVTGYLATYHTSEHREVQASLANLVLACHTFQKGFSVVIESFFLKNARLPTKLELEDLIKKFNENHLPRMDKAGQIECQIGELRVNYNVEGRLVIGTNMDRILRRSFLSEVNKDLSEEDVKRIKSIYHSLADNCPYNNASGMLEFMRYYRENKMRNPTLTLKEAFASFSPNPAALYDKYRSGTCTILSAKVGQALREAGYHSEQVGVIGENSWNSLPINLSNKSGGVVWKEFSATNSNVDHVRTILRYVNTEGQREAILLEAGFANDRVLEFESTPDQNGWEMLEEYTPTMEKEALSTLDSLLKGRISANFKMIIQSSNPKEIYGIDLLNNNIYLNSDGAKGLTGLPKNVEGRVSIALADLLVPGAKGVYYVDGEAVIMTHHEALKLLIEKTRDRFSLPEDFYDNICALSETADALFDDILLKPLKTLRTVYPQLNKISKQSKEFSEFIEHLEKGSDLYNAENAILKSCEEIFSRIEKEIKNDNLVLVQEALAEYQREFEKSAFFASLPK